MDEEFKFEEVVICSHAEIHGDNLTLDEARNAHSFLKFGEWKVMEKEVISEIPKDVFIRVMETRIGRFYDEKKNEYSYNLQHNKTNRNLNTLFLKSKSKKSNDLKFDYLEDYTHKSKFTISYNREFWTVLTFSGMNTQRRFMAVDLRSMELVANFQLPYTISGLAWTVLKIDTHHLTVVTNSNKNTEIIVFDIKTGKELLIIPAPHMCTHFVVERKWLFGVGLEYAVRLRIPLGDGYTIKEAGELFEWDRVFKLNRKAKTQSMSMLNKDLVIFSREPNRETTIELMNRELTRIKDRIVWPSNLALHYSDSLPVGNLDLFEIRGHTFKLFSITQVFKENNIIRYLHLLTSVKGKLVTTCFAPIFKNSIRVYGYTSAMRVRRRLFSVLGFGKMEDINLTTRNLIGSILVMTQPIKNNGNFELQHHSN